jgi:hypothetical protein
MSEAASNNAVEPTAPMVAFSQMCVIQGAAAHRER